MFSRGLMSASGMPLAVKPAKIAGQLPSDWLPVARERASAWMSFVGVVVIVRSPNKGETVEKDARNIRALFVGVVVFAADRAAVTHDHVHYIPAAAHRLGVQV